MSNTMNWNAKLGLGLDKTRLQLSGGISRIFGKGKLTDDALEELEDLLISADIGVSATTKIIKNIAKQNFDSNASPEQIGQIIANNIAELLEKSATFMEIDQAKTPQVILTVGVNGNGKTTSIGKMAHILREQGFSVLIAACDTFRAAAVEQLKTWADRSESEFFESEHQADPASVCFKAIQHAKANNIDIVLVDTAGRLHNKSNLMAELEKIRNVCGKVHEGAPHHTLLVLDATTGQNALNQIEEFKKFAQITGVIINKLDGTAKGGIVVAIADKFGLPIHAIGVGEGIDDMQSFDAKVFANNLIFG